MLDKFKQLLKRAGTVARTWNQGWNERGEGNGRRDMKCQRGNELGKGRVRVIKVHVSTSFYPFLIHVLLIKS